MQKQDITITVTVGLVFIAGLIFGQGFSFEVKLGDILALGAALGTLWFANNGIRHNERQYLNTISPVIEKMEIHYADFGYEFSLHNYGSGAALKIEYTIYQCGKILDPVTFRTGLISAGGSKDFHVGGEVGISPSSKVSLIKVRAMNRESYKNMLHFIKDIELGISFKDVQGRKFYERFSLTPPSNF